MGNRRTKSEKSARKRTPREFGSVFDELPSLSVPRSLGSWFLLGLKVIVGLALIVGAVGSLAWGVHRYAQTTPRFAVVNVEIEGTRRLARDDVLGAAGVQKGDNLFALDVEKAEASLLSSPWIAQARVIRQLPGTIRLEVVERDAVALAVIGSKTFLVSQDGEPFKEMGSGDPHDLPIVTGLSLLSLSKDRRAELSRLRDTLGLLRDYEKLPIAHSFPIEEVHLEPSGDAVLTVGSEGISMHLGATPWKRKLLRAERVLQRTRKAGGQPSVVFLDNDAHPERVVVRVR